MLMVQADVFSEADSVTSVITVVDADSKGTSIRNHAVPSFAIAQSVLPVAVDVTGKNRFTAATVFGVVV
jgi:hypothetical protein